MTETRFIASKRLQGKNQRHTSGAHLTREIAAEELFLSYPGIKSCSTSEAYYDGKYWLDRNTDIRFHDRPYKVEK